MRIDMDQSEGLIFFQPFQNRVSNGMIATGRKRNHALGTHRFIKGLNFHDRFIQIEKVINRHIANVGDICQFIGIDSCRHVKGTHQ